MWFTLNWPLTNWAEQHCLKPKINISKQATPAQLILCFKPLVRPDLSTTNGSQLSSSNFIANCKERHKTPLYPHHSFASPTSTQKDMCLLKCERWMRREKKRKYSTAPWGYQKWNYYVRRGFSMQELCLVRGLEELHQESRAERAGLKRALCV